MLAGDLCACDTGTPKPRKSGVPFTLGVATSVALYSSLQGGATQLVGILTGGPMERSCCCALCWSTRLGLSLAPTVLGQAVLGSLEETLDTGPSSCSRAKAFSAFQSRVLID